MNKKIRFNRKTRKIIKNVTKAFNEIYNENLYLEGLNEYYRQVLRIFITENNKLMLEKKSREMEKMMEGYR
jgi:hypothetical protein